VCSATAENFADAVPEIGAVVAARSFCWTISRGNDYGFALFHADGVSNGLRSRPLFDYKLAARELRARPAERKDHLKREHHVPVQSPF